MKFETEHRCAHQQGLPFIHAEMLAQEAFDYYINTIFATDRRGTPKGMIEVLL